jgi:putative endonuclease
MARDHNYYTYIVSDNKRATIYIGVTNNLERRIWQHRNPQSASFTQAYHCGVLLYFEQFPDILAAISREKQLKGWTRRKKDELIKTTNPRMLDLAEGWF